MSEFSDKARELASRFDGRWGPFTQSLAGHPKTALALGAIVGLALGLLLGWAFF